MAEKKKKKKKQVDPSKLTEREKKNPQHLNTTIKAIRKRKLALQNI